MVPSIEEKGLEPTDISANASVVEITASEAAGYDRSATKKLLRRLDWHIIPFMSLIYLSVSSSTDTFCGSNWFPDNKR